MKHALAALIDEVREVNHWSDPEIAARAQQAGYRLSKSHISGIRNKPVIGITLDNINALAAGLGVSRSVVANAALASMGIVTIRAADLDSIEAIRQDPQLGEGDRATLITLIQTMRSRRSGAKQLGGYGAAAAGSDPDSSISRDSAIATEQRQQTRELTDAEVTDALRRRDLEQFGDSFR